MKQYKILAIKKEWTELTKIIASTKMDCLVENQETREVSRKIVTFFQLVDLYDAKKDMCFSVNSKIKVEDIREAKLKDSKDNGLSASNSDKKENPFYRPSYYMRTNKDIHEKNKLEQISAIKKEDFNLPEIKEYKINLEKIKSLEEAKEVLGALNIRVASMDGEILPNGHNMNVLMKYIDMKDSKIESVDFNEIKLEFENGVSRLVGLELGKNIYKTQVEGKVDYSKKNIIVIPNEIEDVAITFVQGLTEGIFDNIKKDEFQTYFEVRGSQKVIDKVIKSIYF